jgi:hypothetical protein
MNVIIKGTEYALQPFTAGQLRREASAKLAAIEDLSLKLGNGQISTGAAMPELVGNACDLVLLSVNNGAAGLTLEDVETLTFGDLQKAVTDACEASGLSGEVKPQPTRSL